MEKKVISPFEFAIMKTIDPEKSKDFRAETEQEKYDRIEKDFRKTASQLKVAEINTLNKE